MASLECIDKVISEVSRQHPEELAELRSKQSSVERAQVAIETGIFDKFINIKPSYKEKCTKTAEALRAEGNHFFKKKKHVKALEKYNDSILIAPFPSEDDRTNSSTSLSLGIANRSAVLYQLGKYKACLCDVSDSLEFGYPESQQYKLYDRAARSHQMLQQWTEAQENFTEAMKAVDLSGLEQTTKAQWSQKLTQEIQRCQKNLGKRKQPAESQQVPRIPEVSGDNKQYPCACAAFDVAVSATVGRHVIARDAVRVGAVVMVEEPYAHVLYTSHYSSHCHHCTVPVQLPYPCQQCAAVIYCSKACSQLSWQQYHKIECQHLGWLSEKWLSKLGHVALRMVINFAKDGLPTDIPSSESQQLEESSNHSYSKFGQLVTHEGDRDWMSDFQLITMAVFLTKLLKSTGSMEPVCTAERVTCFHLLQALQVVQCNGIAITEMENVDDFQKCVPKDIGQALYLTVSLGNHSCDPSTDLTFYGNKCVVRAIKNISPGGEIAYDYGPVFSVEGKSDRQRHLRQNYFFDCACVACVNDWPMFDRMECSYPKFRCQKCGLSLDVDKKGKCSGCSAEFSLTKAIERLSESHQLYSKGAMEAFQGNTTQALPALENHLSLMQQLLCQPWKEFYSCQATTKQCYRILSTKYSQQIAAL